MIMYKYKLLLQTSLLKGHWAKKCVAIVTGISVGEKGANVGSGLCVSVMGTVGTEPQTTFDPSQPHFSPALLTSGTAPQVESQLCFACFNKKHTQRTVQIENQPSWHATPITQFCLVIHYRWFNKWVVGVLFSTGKSLVYLIPCFLYVWGWGRGVGIFSSWVSISRQRNHGLHVVMMSWWARAGGTVHML